MIVVVPTIEQLCSQTSKNNTICSACKKIFRGESAMKTHLRRSHKVFKVKLIVGMLQVLIEIFLTMSLFKKTVKIFFLL